MQLTKDKNFYKTIINISIPITLQNLITVSVNMADTVMLGKLGQIQLSASSIGGHLFFMLMILMFGLGGGASVMSAQYYGKKDMSSIHSILNVTYKLAIMLSIIFLLISILLPKEFMMLFTNDKYVINQGIKYIRIVSISYIFYSLTISTSSVLRAVKNVKAPMIINSISLLINITFNYILIFGKFGIKPLGIQGAAIATVISRCSEFLLVVLYMMLFEKKIKYKMNFIRNNNKEIRDKFIRVTTPIFLNELFWTIGSSTISIIVARMGTKVVAANSINNIVYQFALLFIQGLSSASSVIIGNTIGKGLYKKVKEYANTIAILSLISGIMAAIVVYVTRLFIVDIYNVSIQTKLIAKDIMIATAICIFFRALGSTLMMGVLRGAGDNKFVFKYEMIFMWCVAIPLGFIGVFYFKFNVPTVFLLLKSDEILKGIAAYIRVRKGNWINNVTLGDR